MAHVQLFCMIPPKFNIEITNLNRRLEVACNKEEYENIVKQLGDINIEVYLAKLTDTYLIAGPYKNGNRKYSILLLLTQGPRFVFSQIIEDCIYPYENTVKVGTIKLSFNTLDDEAYYNANLRIDGPNSNIEVADTVQRTESEEKRLNVYLSSQLFSFFLYPYLNKLKDIVKSEKMTLPKIRLLSLSTLNLNQISELTHVFPTNDNNIKDTVLDYVLKYGINYASIYSKKIVTVTRGSDTIESLDYSVLFVHEPMYVTKLELMLYFAISRRVFFVSDNDKKLIFNENITNWDDRFRKLKDIGIEKLLRKF